MMLRKISLLSVFLLFGLLVSCSDDDNGTTSQTISQLVADNNQLDTIQIALKAAGLDSTLNTAGPFTLFAPTDSAFTALPAGVLTALLADSSVALKNVLLYHTSPEKLTAAQITALSSISTVQGKAITVDTTGGKVMLNDSIEVIMTDIVAKNGIIHLIKGVLIP